MRLLILTQKVDNKDSVLGFFHRWIFEFSKYADYVTVVCLEKGEYDLPSHVNVLSLGKEVGASRFRYVFNFYRYIWKERKKYDVIFVHMNPEYVVMGGFFWKFLGKKICLWYTHRQIDLKLRLAHFFTDVVCTASESSFQIPSLKRRVVGHGIDVEKFLIKENNVKEKRNFISVLHVGRITPIKNIDVLIEAIHILNKSHKKRIKVDLVGAPVTSLDCEYKESLMKLIQQNNMGDVINFKGEIPNEKVAFEYRNADISVNLAPTGGLDKSVLESMAAGVPVLVSNKGFELVFERFSKDLIFRERSVTDLAEKFENLIENKNMEVLRRFLVDKAMKHYSVQGVVSKIISCLK